MLSGKRTCLLVLGMHRSGTSALTRVLNMAGAALPQRVLGAREGNETGHWEPRALVDWSDRLLRALGTTWHNWEPLDFSKLSKLEEDRYRSELLDIIEQDYAGKDFFVVKDPRLCRFVPFFVSVLEEAGIQVVPILIIRNPLDVMRSLQARGVLWPPHYRSADAALLWLTHVLASETATRGMTRAIVSYDLVLRDWRATLAQISSQSGISFPRSEHEIESEVGGFLTSGQRHHAYSKADLALDPVTRGWVVDAYGALSELASETASGDALETLDFVGAEITTVLPMLAQIHEARGGAIQEVIQRTAYYRGTLAEEGFKRAETEAELDRWKYSWSFRLTAPLRATNSALQKALAGGRAVAGVVKQRGGIVPTVKKTIYMLRFHGVSGLRQRVENWVQTQRKIRVRSVARRSTPFVSIIVPNYNHAKYLRQRLDTILAQTYQNFELILLDDCSSDESLQIMQEYEDRDPHRIRLIANAQNSGSGYRQWAKGISLAEGELVWIAESDDWSDPRFLENLIPAFEDESVMLAYANSAFMDEAGTKRIWSTPEYLADLDRHLWRAPFNLPAQKLVRIGWSTKNIVPNVSSAVFRHPGRGAELLDDPFTEMKICGDWLFYLNLVRGGKVYYRPDILNYYRVHGESTAQKIYSKDIYYSEHEDVARYVLENFSVSFKFVYKQEENLREHWKQHRGEAELWRLPECYNPARILEGSGKRKPSVMMAGFAFSAGGGETFPIFLANLLKERGFSVTFLSCEMEPRQEGVKNLLRSDIPVETNFANLAGVIEAYEIDVIHSHHASVDNAIALHVPKESQVKRVVSMHGMYEMMERIDQEVVVPRIVKAADALVYTSMKNLKPFENLELVDQANLIGIPNALPETPLHPVRREDLGVPEDAFLLCEISRAIPEKGWSEAIESVALARSKSDKDIRLLLIGQGPEFDRLVEEGTPDFVTILGYKQNLRDYFATCDLGLLPSRFQGESFPLTLIDCLAAGRPFLASELGEIPLMLSADEGLAGDVFALSDGEIPIEQLAEKIARAAERGSYYRDMVRAVPSAYKKFDPSVMIERYIEVYRQLLEEDEETSEMKEIHGQLVESVG